MHTPTASTFAQALARQRKLTDGEWLQRCNALATQQQFLFLELVTFGRDGASEAQTRCLVEYLSLLQWVAVTVSESTSAPVELEELRPAVDRAIHFFYASTTNDQEHFRKMMRGWYEGVAKRNEPVWALCIETLQQHGIMSSPLAQGMVVTLYAIADVFSRRFSNTRDDGAGRVQKK